ncbi:hypothetical protein A1O7_02197 [Cladophialophora yegresii CBS 114405]|uniref:Class II aldolase/adducin N-terminal domain-containing protein n=1 Tax=Cladophialophora yegresii CBS 114405 TaxID=1182544 RepID=W9W114_9EURO|nr:uncharacterized protein A1O7_02197 [Cladophialophora yegresii CBS 114405]EXJ61767.1 hypothetical protein A1O7_02197 [Cladophialophora yegresii CBS 114405]
MSANTAPALVRSAADFAEYNVSDAQPAHRDGPRKGFVERYIHSELYKWYAGVVCVIIHAHADDILPYTRGHVFHVERHYQRGDPGDVHDLLVKNMRLGTAFAGYFSWTGHHHTDLPTEAVVLMRRHGFTTWRRGLKEAVYRAVYTTKNAKSQTTATLLRGVFDADPKNTKGEWEDGAPTGPVNAFEPLTRDQARDTHVVNARAGERVWGVWVQEVKCQALYTSSVYQG